MVSDRNEMDLSISTAREIRQLHDLSTRGFDISDRHYLWAYVIEDAQRVVEDAQSAFSYKITLPVE